MGRIAIIVGYGPQARALLDSHGRNELREDVVLYRTNLCVPLEEFGHLPDLDFADPGRLAEIRQGLLDQGVRAVAMVGMQKLANAELKHSDILALINKIGPDRDASASDTIKQFIRDQLGNEFKFVAAETVLRRSASCQG